MKKNAVKAINKEKAESLFQTIIEQYDKVETTISFDYSIAFSTANVKYPEQIISTKISKNSVEITVTNEGQTPNGQSSAENTYSRKENTVMEKLELFVQDNRSLQQWLPKSRPL